MVPDAGISFGKSDSDTLRVFVPRVFMPLRQEGLRYRGAYGGRGSGKSHFFAGYLVERCLREDGVRAVCIREVQRSIKESSKRLI